MMGTELHLKLLAGNSKCHWLIQTILVVKLHKNINATVTEIEEEPMPSDNKIYSRWRIAAAIRICP